MSHGNGFTSFNYCIALLNELVFPYSFFFLVECVSVLCVYVLFALHIHNRRYKRHSEWIVSHFHMVVYILTYLIVLLLVKCGVAMNMINTKKCVYICKNKKHKKKP